MEHDVYTNLLERARQEYEVMKEKVKEMTKIMTQMDKRMNLALIAQNQHVNAKVEEEEQLNE